MKQNTKFKFWKYRHWLLVHNWPIYRYRPQKGHVGRSLNFKCIFRKPTLENMKMDTNFIIIGPTDLELYLFLCCSSMWMPS